MPAIPKLFQLVICSIKQVTRFFRLRLSGSRAESRTNCNITECCQTGDYLSSSTSLFRRFDHARRLRSSAASQVHPSRCLPSRVCVCVVHVSVPTGRLTLLVYYWSFSKGVSGVKSMFIKFLHISTEPGVEIANCSEANKWLSEKNKILCNVSSLNPNGPSSHSANISVFGKESLAAIELGLEGK